MEVSFQKKCLVVCEFDSGSSGSGSRGLRTLFLLQGYFIGKDTLISFCPLSTKVYKWITANLIPVTFSSRGRRILLVA